MTIRYDTTGNNNPTRPYIVITVRNIGGYNPAGDPICSGAITLYLRRGYYPYSFRFWNLTLPKHQAEPGRLVHLLKREHFLKVLHIYALTYILKPRPHSDGVDWEKKICEKFNAYDDMYDMSEFDVSLQGGMLASTIANTNARVSGDSMYPDIAHKLNEEHQIHPIEMTICAECGSIRCQNMACSFCGSQQGIPTWMVLFTTFDDLPSKQWFTRHCLTFDKFTKSTVRRKARDYIKRKRFVVADNGNKPYNGIYVLSSDTVGRTVHSAITCAVECRRQFFMESAPEEEPATEEQ